MTTTDLANLANSFYNNLQGQALLFPPNPESIRSQCVQPVMFYMRDYLRTPVRWRGTAAEYAYSGDGLTWVPNDANNPSQLPPKGAMIIWFATLPGSGGSGHIAVYFQTNDNHTFVSVDSNWGGKVLKLVTHNWQYVAGWLIPDGLTAPAPAPVQLASATITTNTGDTNEMITSRDDAIKIYKMLRPNSNPDDGEIGQTAGKRSYAQFVNDAQTEVSQRDANLAAQAAELANVKNINDQLNATVTNLTTSTTANKADYDSAIAKVAELTSQLATSHDTISDLQDKLKNPVAVSVAQAQNVEGSSTYKDSSWIVKAIYAIFFKNKKH